MSIDDEKVFLDELRKIEQEPDVKQLLSEMLGPSTPPDHNVVCFSGDPTGFGLSLILVVPVLYAWAKIRLNRSRAKAENDTVNERIEMVASLMKIGYPQKAAEDLVLHQLEIIAHHDKAEPTLDDSALKKIIVLASKVQGTPGLLLGHSEDDNS